MASHEQQLPNQPDRSAQATDPHNLLIRRLQEELEQTRRCLAEKTEEVETLRQHKPVFLANLSHELRTPLNSVIVFSQILAENKGQNLTPKQVEFARMIHSAGNQLLRVVEAVLDFSALEAGAIMLQTEDLNLQRFAAWIEQTFRPLTEQKGIVWRLMLDATLPAQIVTDRQRLEQLLRHLMSNALKFTATGQIQVQMIRPPVDLPLPGTILAQRAIAIRVSDTGIGIPEAHRSRIFNAFMQGDSSTTRRYEGLGLGLTIARALTDLLGGVIAVESQEGHGSTFTVVLPERPAAQPQTAASADLSPVAFSVDAIRDDRRELTPQDQVILIIENDTQAAKLLFDQARERGLKCLLAGDGEAGMLLAHQYHPQAILLSLDLPGADGWTVMERLNTELAVEHLPLYLVFARQAAAQILKRAGLRSWQKPITQAQSSDIFDTLTNLFAKSGRKVSPAPAYEQEQPQGLPGRGKTVVLIEADMRNVFGVSYILEEQGIQVKVAENGTAALTLFETLSTPDLIILATELPDMSGEDMLQRLRQRRTFTTLPIIMLSQKAQRGERRHYLQRGASEYLSKPIHPDKLLSLLRVWLY